MSTAEPLVLGIETSCDETAAAVVSFGGRVRSSVVASQHELHEEYGGVVPEIASRAHVERILPVVRESLREAGIGLDRLSGVAVGHRPGLIGSILIGLSAAKALAWSLGVPLIGVDHVHAHLFAGMLREADGGLDADPRFPALGLVVLEFRDHQGQVVQTLPSERQLAAYRSHPPHR
jgi:N6-L-threonylcarbamoyladenine synthase